MKKIVNKYSCVFFFFIISSVVLADGPVPPGPPGYECCYDLYMANEIDKDTYEACNESVNPNAYCNMLPIDNSRYIYISIVAGVVLASFVIAKKMNTKKTPM